LRPGLYILLPINFKVSARCVNSIMVSLKVTSRKNRNRFFRTFTASMPDVSRSRFSWSNFSDTFQRSNRVSSQEVRGFIGAKEDENHQFPRPHTLNLLPGDLKKKEWETSREGRKAGDLQRRND
jgi:hypothetical protein